MRMLATRPSGRKATAELMGPGLRERQRGWAARPGAPDARFPHVGQEQDAAIREGDRARGLQQHDVPQTGQLTAGLGVPQLREAVMFAGHAKEAGAAQPLAVRCEGDGMDDGVVGHRRGQQNPGGWHVPHLDMRPQAAGPRPLPDGGEALSVATQRQGDYARGAGVPGGDRPAVGQVATRGSATRSWSPAARRQSRAGGPRPRRGAARGGRCGGPPGRLRGPGRRRPGRRIREPPAVRREGEVGRAGIARGAPTLACRSARPTSSAGRSPPRRDECRPPSRRWPRRSAPARRSAAAGTSPHPAGTAAWPAPGPRTPRSAARRD